MFEEILATIENEDIKKYAEECIKTIPAYFYSVPASSTGKYHPKYALGEGGLMRHTVALCLILNHILNVESIREQFTSRERDLMRVAGIMHDTRKSGSQEDYEKNKYTKFDHPLQAAQIVRSVDGLKKEEIDAISLIIESHMGQWNTDKRDKTTVLPKPESKCQILVHLADYLASRKDIEIIFENVPNKTAEEIPEEKPDINTWRFNFGKHNGKTIPEVDEIDHQYIEWAKNNITREPVKSLLQMI